MNRPSGKSSAPAFTPYQKAVIAMLAFIQFTVVLDFMMLSPLGVFLLPGLSITPAQFGLVVSVYAFSAGASGLLAAGFADRHDRKRILLFFYSGFVLGTLFCGLAPDYSFLLAARIVTGVFGGVISGISYAIIADLFPFQVRGRVMGYIQTSFAASQVLGIPFGLFLANLWGWRAGFLMIVAASIPVGLVIALRLKPVAGHLATPSDRNPLQHLVKTLAEPRYFWAFLATTLLATGGYMLNPFGTAFAANNLGISMDHLPWIFMVPGIATMFMGPLFGRIIDSVGKLPVFVAGSLLALPVINWYCHLGTTPLWLVLALNVTLYLAINARMIAGASLTTALPEPMDRGAFMSVNSALQQFSGGLASMVAGLIVKQAPDGRLAGYDTLGLVVSASMLITVFFMYRINQSVMEKAAGPGRPSRG